MKEDQRLQYKMYGMDEKYDRQIKKMMGHSHQTFDNIQTPGWSSLVKSQISSRKNNNRQLEIMQKLAKLQAERPHKENSQFHESITLMEQESTNYLNKTMKNRISNNQNSRGKIKNQILKKQSGNANNLREIKVKQDNVVSKSGIKVVRGKNGEKIKIDKQKQNNRQKRWNQISVHDYLYLNSKKMENKRIIQKIVDDEYKKKQIYKFTPQINPKSIEMAESKFSRIQQKKLEEDQQHDQKQQNDLKNIKAGKQQNKQNKEVIKYQILNKTFYFLARQKPQLEKQELHQVIEQLPLVCIKTLQPILQKIYAGQSMSWIQFVQLFNGKLIENRESFYIVMNKWFKKLDKNQQKPQTPQQQIK